MSVSGNQLYTNDVILSQLTLAPGDPFLPAAAERSLDGIRDLYWAKVGGAAVPARGEVT